MKIDGQLSELLSEQVRIETEITDLKKNCCKGKLSEKVIKGKPQIYLQWYEDGKTKCRYVRKAELPELEEQLTDRDRKLRLLENQLKNIQEKISGLINSVPDSAASPCLREACSPYGTAVNGTVSCRTVSGVFDGLNIIPEELLPLKKGTRVHIVYCPDAVPDDPLSVLDRYSGTLSPGQGLEIESFIRKERDNDRSF